MPHGMTPLRYVDGAPFLLAGIRRRHAYASAPTSIAEQWQALPGVALPALVSADAYGAICGHDAQGFEYLCGREVASFDALPDTCGRMRVPAQRYAVFAHDGPVTTLAESWRDVFVWLAASPYTSAEGPDFERYGARFDEQAGRGDIEIWLGIVPRAAAHA